MTRRYDAIVVGLGAMGSAAARALAERGLEVLGLDRYRPPHLFGSSHGGSRIIREAYYEDPRYVPLIRRAYREWQALERDAGTELWRRTGGLMIGPRGGRLVRGALASARAHGLAHEELDADELARRFPSFRPRADDVAVWEPRAGILFPEAAVEAQLRAARAAGAELRFEEPVAAWRPDGDGFAVTLPEGEARAGSLVLACGAWLGELVADLALPLAVERVVQHWFGARAGWPALGPEALPIFLWEYRPESIFYGFPDLGEGLKMALHYQGERTTAAEIRRRVDPDEVLPLRRLFERYLPAANGPHLRSEVCMYTNTPDLHFLVDRHPEHERVWLVSPCSGHGFKFAPVIGAAVAAALVGDPAGIDLAPFGLARLRPAAAVE